MPTLDYKIAGYGKLRIHWGVCEDQEITTPEGTETIAAFEQIKSGPETLTFEDPLYPSESKTLHVYRHSKHLDYFAVFGEITMGVYAIGHQIR
jgi:hypothetical protein